MSHYPWILQQALGIEEPPRALTTPRTEILTEDTPTTFGEVNWNHCENGSARPIANDDATILMGPAITAAAGVGAEFRALHSTVVVHSAQLLRAAGWVVDIIPDDYESDNGGEEKGAKEEDRSTKRPKKEELTVADREKRYIESNSYRYQPFQIKEQSSGKVVGRMRKYSLDDPWLCIVSTSPILTNSVKEKMTDSFALCEMKCTDFALSNPLPGYTLTGVTGVEDESVNPSTLFLLKFGDKIVGKALCTYKNGEMASVGPTLELIEVAMEWRRHGLGTLIMREIENYYEDVFEPAIEENGSILFAVCYVTNSYASMWFQNHLFFQDLDGMGEELGKELEPRPRYK